MVFEIKKKNLGFVVHTDFLAFKAKHCSNTDYGASYGNNV